MPPIGGAQEDYVETMETEDLTSPAKNELLDDERHELEIVLKSAFRPQSNMALMLRYVCEKAFAGLGHEIKEYNIAVEALERPPDFEPSKDSIVRVEAHRLRSRLDRYYRQNPSLGNVRIQIPSGSYVPQFPRREGHTVLAEQEILPQKLDGSELATIEVSGKFSVQEESPETLPPPTVDSVQIRHKGRTAWITASIVLILLITILIFLVRRHQQSQDLATTTPSAASPPLDGVRILAGVSSTSFIDAHGTAWMGDRYFVGGHGESITPRAIAFADDSSIFTKRRRGLFAYDIPLHPGTYELRLYFADAFFGEGNLDGGGEASRLFDVTANGKSLLKDFDVISDAGGSNTSDVKVFKDIKPGKDGFIHLSFVPKRDVAFINAIEVIRSVPHRTLPVRITMSRTGYTDERGIYWESDRYYRGGVDLPSDVVPDSGASLNQRIGERFGNFTYAIPVAPTDHYSVTMTFKDSRTPKTLGNASESEPNVFNVYVNGQTIFDRLVVPANGSSSKVITKTIENLQPNAQGKLIFSFVPVQNYAVVSSIEVLDQGQ
jgi:Malectin domain